MKYLLLIALLSLMACSNGDNSNTQACQVKGTAQYNNQTVNLINGVCSMESQTNWENSSYVENLMCGRDVVTQNGQVCQMLATDIGTATTGCTVQSDGYVVTPSSDGTEQCWFLINNGQIAQNATPPTF